MVLGYSEIPTTTVVGRHYDGIMEILTIKMGFSSCFRMVDFERKFLVATHFWILGGKNFFCNEAREAGCCELWPRIRPRLDQSRGNLYNLPMTGSQPTDRSWLRGKRESFPTLGT
jgi:hypothetical protein